MVKQPGCWHCRYPHAYWTAVAVLAVAVFLPPPVWLGVLSAVVLWANVGQFAVLRLRAVR